MYGARPIKRSIQKLLEDEFAEAFIKGALKNGDRIKVDVSEGKLVYGYSRDNLPDTVK
jgi:ATP-dependent Clp protease ATP-binding subunit ClpA